MTNYYDDLERYVNLEAQRRASPGTNMTESPQEMYNEWRSGKYNRPLPSTSELLAERGKTHGDYADHAVYTQNIKDVLRTSKNWFELTSEQCESLEMIAHKIGRILAGDPNHKDHWLDIAGYAQLVVDSLNDKPE